MRTSVMLSIKPVYADQIFEGSKQYEFRRRLFSNRSVRRVVVYVTAPVSKVIGEFEVEDIIELEPEALWEQTKHHSGIAKGLFDAYFEGKKVGYALKIGNTRMYDVPLELEQDFNVRRAPQSFVYL